MTNSHRNPTFNIVKENKNKFAQIAIQSSTNLFRSQDAENFFDLTTVCYVMNPKFVLNNNNIDIAGIEFLEDEEGKLYTYYINTNTNYNNTAENLTKYNGMKSIAEYLYGELKLL